MSARGGAAPRGGCNPSLQPLRATVPYQLQRGSALLCREVNTGRFSEEEEGLGGADHRDWSPGRLAESFFSPVAKWFWSKFSPCQVSKVFVVHEWNHQSVKSYLQILKGILEILVNNSRRRGAAEVSRWLQNLRPRSNLLFPVFKSLTFYRKSAKPWTNSNLLLDSWRERQHF